MHISTDGVGDGEVLAEQIDFYRADAESYDRWLAGLLVDDNDEPAALTYRAGRALIAQAFERRAPLGRVLEIAAGTGRLVELYAPHARSIVVLDASPESLAIAARRTKAAPQITAVEADIFDWDSDGQRFDTVVFTAWLHHVPQAALDRFWVKVESLLAEGGRVIFDFADSDVAPGARWEIPSEPTREFSGYAQRDGISIRDQFGKRWRVVHNLWDPNELSARLAHLGWKMNVLGTGLFANLAWAEARRSECIG